MNYNADSTTTPTNTFVPVSVIVLGAPISLVDDSLAVSGSLTLLNIADFIFGSANFEITLSTVAVDLPAPQSDIALASLLTVGLTNLNLTIGDLAGPHFSIVGGSLALAVLKPKTPAPGDTRSWLALEGSVTTASFVGVDNLTVTVLNLSFEINRASGIGGATPLAATPLDWATALEDEVTAAGVAIDLSGDVLRASGVIRINIFDLVSGVVGFGFEQQIVDVDVDDNGFSTAVGSTDLSGATLTTLGLRIIPDDGNALNGAEGLFVGAAGIGFSIASGSLALAIVKPAAPTDTRGWMALAANVSGGSFDGIDGLTMVVNQLNVELNRGSAPTGQTAPAALNWLTAIDLEEGSTGFAADAIVVRVATPLGIEELPIAYEDERFRASGNVTIDIFGFVSGTVGFSLETKKVKVDFLIQRGQARAQRPGANHRVAAIHKFVQTDNCCR